MKLEDHVLQANKVQQHDIHSVVCESRQRMSFTVTVTVYCDFLQLCILQYTICYLSILSYVIYLYVIHSSMHDDNTLHTLARVKCNQYSSNQQYLLFSPLSVGKAVLHL